ncbi:MULTISPECIES: porin [unclassified Duganella]|uniref:porin n=1 Tax=unclassified Duganella TaxID=2636909 RepID=UPI000E3474FC|nr:MULTISPECIES: porin [unclassified Duganella]RFP19249.1 porin [Duganella sp. BJB475]RFP35830.1 porin [Duganella sp. BJB476]
MKKKAIALACMAAWQAAAQAQSNVAIYGNFDEYVGYIRSSSGAHITGLNDGAVLRSRLGFRGTEDIGGGYKVKFTLEQGINADTGTGADTTRLFDRQAWVGIEAPSGEYRIGRQNTEIFLIGGAIDYTERTTFGSLFNTFGIPSRYDNDLSYRSPRLAGAQLVLHYALPENGGATRGNSPIYQLALDYRNGPYRVGYAGLQASPNTVTATVRDKVVYHNVYADYQYGGGTIYLAAARSNNSTSSANGLNAGVILNNVSNPNNFFAGTDRNAARYYNFYQVSADYRVSSQLRVGALYGVIRDTSGGEAGARGANAGAYYELSKRTTLYGFASVMQNQANAGFRFSGSAGPSANLAGADINGKHLTGLQAGILHKF